VVSSVGALWRAVWSFFNIRERIEGYVSLVKSRWANRGQDLFEVVRNANYIN